MGPPQPIIHRMAPSWKDASAGMELCLALKRPRERVHCQGSPGGHQGNSQETCEGIQEETCQGSQEHTHEGYEVITEPVKRPMGEPRSTKEPTEKPTMEPDLVTESVESPSRQGRSFEKTMNDP